MKPAIIFAVFRRELLDLLRDRRSLISSILLSLLGIPLLMGFVSFFLQKSIDRSRLAATTVAAAPGLAEAYKQALQKAGLRLVEVPQVLAAVEQEVAATGLLSDATGLSFEVLVDETSPSSGRAASKTLAALQSVKDSLVLARLRQAGLAPEVLEPIRLRRRSVTSQEKMGGFVLGSIAGYVIILVMFSRVLGVSIDVTVGEKQRGTMESLVSSPAPRASLAMGKALTCISASFLAGLLVTISLFYTFSNKGFQIEGMKNFVGQIPTDPRTLVLLLLVMLCLAVFAGTLMLAIASAARSSKEAQSYLSPLLTLTIFPALLGGLPGMEISPALSWIPVLNASQLMKSIIQGQFLVLPFFLVCGSNLLYSLVAMWFAVRNFESDKITRRT